VIAVLDWELSTIGHPLMDAVYVVGPYWNSTSKVFSKEGRKESGMPEPDELLDRYAEITGWDPRKDKFEIARIFHLVRVSRTSRLFLFSCDCWLIDGDIGRYD